ncbi:MAG: acyloxyacyl hydrolase [Bacteroidetes bacterium]|nr:acyloxyacyl hydrolase [Bacteroidota bacterium]
MKIRLLLLLSLFSLRLSAQRDTISAPNCKQIFISASYQYGFFWAHRSTMDGLVKKHLQGFEVDVIRTGTGEHSYDQPYHYPWIGLAVHVIPLGNPTVLGTGIGIYPFINFPLGKRSRIVKMNIRFGWGAGYVTKCFDPLENHANVAIGSHLNVCMSLRYDLMWKLNDDNYLEFGIGITHFSDGAAKLPNLGVNLPMLSVGYHHAVIQKLCTKPSPEFETKSEKTLGILANPHWHFNTLVVTGFNDTDPPGGNRYAVLNIVTSAMVRTARKARFGAGLDLMYSDAIRKRLWVEDSLHTTVLQNFQVGGKVCYEFVVGRVFFPIEMGAYIRSRYDNGLFYTRFGARYLVGQHLILNVSLKTHWARAEYLEYGLGWRF